MPHCFSSRRLLALLSAGLLSFGAQAQGPFTGKPVYQIQARRQGTVMGNIIVELFPTIAPHHVANWDSLVAHMFYDSTAFHRVVPGFVIQGGDPNSRHGPRSTWGYGQPGQPTVNAEFSPVSHQRGILSAARNSDPNSADSQFFICVAAATHLDGNYSAYGRVTSGMNVVDQIVSAPRDANDNPIQKIEMFVTRIGSNDSVPAIPTPHYPLPGAVGVLEQPVLRWGRVPDAMLYHMQLASDSLFTQLIYDETVRQIDTAYRSGSLLPATTYYWRMEANNGGHLSGFSSAWRFQTGMVPPTLVLPLNGATAQPLQPLLEWQALPTATSYRVQVSRSAQFLPSLILLDQAGIPGTTWQLPTALIPNTRYYWRVQGDAGNAPGFWSGGWNFRTDNTTAVAADVADDPRLYCFPNPAHDYARLHYQMPTAGPVRLRVFDVLGREVARPVAAAAQAAGPHEAALPTAHLAPGTYFYRLETTDLTLTRRLVVQ